MSACAADSLARAIDKVTDDFYKPENKAKVTTNCVILYALYRKIQT